MVKKDYSDYTKGELIKELHSLRKRKKYGLVWEQEKIPEFVVENCKKELPVLIEDIKKDVITKNNISPNILIEGDNYHALSALNYTHSGKIDIIYIDPPYNTGAKTWRYNNAYVDTNDAFKHSKWISFMNKRLLLAKRLLSIKGFIICAIDANEIFPLGLLMDQIFGEKNRVGLVTVIHNPKGRNLSKFFSENSEFMLIYAKNINSAEFNDVVIDEDKKATFNLSDNTGKYRLEPFMRVRTSWSKKNKPKNYYPIYVSKDLKSMCLEKKPNTIEVLPKTKDGREWAWKNISPSFKKLNEEGKIIVQSESGNIQVFNKYYEKQVFKNVWTNKKYHSEFNGTNLLKKILGKNIFEYPKSLYLVQDILKITSKKKSVILDFFAGSGTTGQAVLELNKEDGGNRKFILCTNNENKICDDVCYPRIKKVIQNLQKEKTNNFIPSGLKYFKTTFVKSSPTDKNKKALVNKSTEMLCIKEDTFKLIKKEAKYSIFTNGKKYTGIIYDDDSIPSFKKQVKQLDKKVSWGDYNKTKK